MDPRYSEHDPRLRRALEHYRGGELTEAIGLLEQLEADGHASPEALELLADLRLQQKLIAQTISFREPPKPRRPIWRPIAVGFAVALLLVGAGATAWLRPWEQPVAAAAAPTATVEPTAVPTATVEPTAAPTATVEPTAAPTATVEPTVAPTAAPTATPAPAEPALGQLAVRLPPGQSVMMRTPRNIAIVLDASGSMLAALGEQTKMAIARDAVSATVAGLPAETLLAVRTYGTQRSQDCSDLSLVRPLGLSDRGELLASLGAIQPATEGMTPIGASLDALGADLAGAQGHTAVLLVSDGIENCGGDPVASAAALAAANPQLRIHVIGFDIGDEAATTTLREVARVGGGNYFDAADPAALSSALQEAVQLSYRVLDGDGAVVATGLVGGPALELAAGSYTLRLDSETATEVGAEVPANGVTVFELTPAGDGLTAVAP
jgi:hypothetical protein